MFVKVKTNLKGIMRILSQSPVGRFIVKFKNKLLIFAAVGDNLIVFYTEEEPKGEFLKYNVLDDLVEWSDEAGRESEIIYAPIVRCVEIKGFELE